MQAPAAGASNTSTTPTFMWAPVDGAISYELQIADNEMFRGSLAGGAEKVSDEPLVVRRHITNNVYALATPLEFSTTYWWRVRASTSTVKVAGEEGPWVVGIFTTEAAPPPPPEPEPPAPPPPTPVAPTTPAYIWVIIAIGAVLVVSVIVLIVRTRRIP